jgi:hypothetical protein
MDHLKATRVTMKPRPGPLRPPTIEAVFVRVPPIKLDPYFWIMRGWTKAGLPNMAPTREIEMC